MLSDNTSSLSDESFGFRGAFLCSKCPPEKDVDIALNCTSTIKVDFTQIRLTLGVAYFRCLDIPLEYFTIIF